MIRNTVKIFIIILLVLVLMTTWVVPVSALSISEYFSINYQTQFSKTSILPGEAFTATVSGTAVCIKNLTFPYDVVSEVQITGKIVATGQTGNDIVLNSSYILNIKPFPKTAGESASASQTLNLNFPAGTPEGNYNITGVLIKGEAKAVIWLDVTSFLPVSQSFGTVTVATSVSGGGGGGFSGGGGGAGGGSAAPVISDPDTIALSKDDPLINYLTSDNKITRNVYLDSADSDCRIFVDKATTMTFPQGTQPSLSVEYSPNIVENNNNYWLPENNFKFSPGGVTFNPPLKLTIYLSSLTLPSNISYKNLVIGRLNEQTGIWEQIPCKFDSDKLALTANLEHFSHYSVIAYISPANFELSNMSIYPEDPITGAKVTARFTVSNTGDLQGAYTANLFVDGHDKGQKVVTLDGRSSQTVDMEFFMDAAGSYSLSVGNLTQTLVIKSLVPVTTTPAAATKPSAVATPVITPDAPTKVLAPAEFHYRYISLNQSQIKSGQPLIVDASIFNSGEESGNCHVILKLDGLAEDSRDITLAGGETQKLSFTLQVSSEGKHTISIGDQNATLNVVEPVKSISILWLIPIVVTVCLAVVIIIIVSLRKRKTSLK